MFEDTGVFDEQLINRKQVKLAFLWSTMLRVDDNEVH